MPELRATYRLQLSPEQDFRAVAELVPYLRDLGISHLYLSPSLQARSGSTHGYDVVDPTKLSDALGGEEAFRELAAAGLGIILDIVPNHMGTGDENRWWADEALRVKFFDYDPEDGWYRRFFDIDDLAGLRQEDPEVFETTHAKVLELVREGLVDGLRVDHPDGLADPAGYLQKLRDGGAERVWVEKILHPGEAMRDWPVSGTVGYEFLNDVAGLFVDPAAEGEFTALWAALDGDTRPFAAVALLAQVEQATTTFAREVARLRSLHDVPGIADALASLPIYRTYAEPWSGRVEPADRAAIEAARMDPALARVLLLEEPGHDEFVTRFQQTSPPVTAKGVEDTAFYRHNRLLALNEVGGDPSRFGVPVAGFHAANAERAERFPSGLLVTQTHDTKRSGDVRARIGALTEIPGRWRGRVEAWRELNAHLRADGRGGRGPDPNEEYLIYQTLVGAYPISAERLEAYLEKALREAKRNTSWVEQDHEYEGRVQAFARALLEHGPFLEDLRGFLDSEIVPRGRRAANAQLLLKLTVPGLPDVYQGDELEALALVDPDNRRAVDWAVRREALDALRAGAEPTDATMKLFLIVRALELRAARPGCFDARGGYEPLDAGEDVCAFLRGGDVAVVVPVREAGGAAEVMGLDGRWRDVLTGARLELDGAAGVADLTARHGLALLERD
jgi:(1->4)-alpha-D-glucan 1-alpha-D-glucosylmutase